MPELDNEDKEAEEEAIIEVMLPFCPVCKSINSSKKRKEVGKRICWFETAFGLPQYYSPEKPTKKSNRLRETL